jgi:hypothetical protein
MVPARSLHVVLNAHGATPFGVITTTPPIHMAREPLDQHHREPLAVPGIPQASIFSRTLVGTIDCNRGAHCRRRPNAAVDAAQPPPPPSPRAATTAAQPRPRPRPGRHRCPAQARPPALRLGFVHSTRATNKFCSLRREQDGMNRFWLLTNSTRARMRLQNILFNFLISKY